MTLFVEIVYIFVTVVLILVVLLQAGKGGGLGTALGGGASQGVFGGGGGADFLAKLTQGLATGFMVCAVYLAYASAHTGSSRLEEASTEETELFDEDEEVNYEQVGEGTPLQLPEPGGDTPLPATDVEAAPEVEAPPAEPAFEALPGTEPEAVKDESPAAVEADPTPVEADPPEAAEKAAAEPAADPAAAEVERPEAAADADKPATDAEAPTAEPEPGTP